MNTAVDFGKWVLIAGLVAKVATDIYNKDYAMAVSDGTQILIALGLIHQVGQLNARLKMKGM